MRDSNPQNNDTITGEPGSHPLGTGVGAGHGELAGAAVGTAVAGPLGTLAGAVIEAVAGGLAGKEIAVNADRTEGGAPSEHQLGTGIGASGGAVTGATSDAAGGPIGMAAGAAVGALAGGMADKGMSQLENQKAEDAFWRGDFKDAPGYVAGLNYNDYAPAYQTGYESYGRSGAASFDARRSQA